MTEVICNKATEECGASSVITVSEGQKIVVESKLKQGAIKLVLVKIAENEDEIEKIKSQDKAYCIAQEFGGSGTYEFEVQDGEYYHINA